MILKTIFLPLIGLFLGLKSLAVKVFFFRASLYFLLTVVNLALAGLTLILDVLNEVL
ncbi:hypothetical protein [uncultured Methanobrevibacter sp.]|uniref:hypothetical protein n=1 Tax=uncultured Methanobrevibacter sp. TaxID=253161 RepID=UPI0025E6C707|nr:hypothetical protein [uncultured Methanobrevibacter sp.]